MSSCATGHTLSTIPFSTIATTHAGVIGSSGSTCWTETNASIIIKDLVSKTILAFRSQEKDIIEWEILQEFSVSNNSKFKVEWETIPFCGVADSPVVII